MKNLLLIVLVFFIGSWLLATPVYASCSTSPNRNVRDYGAVGDGIHDDTSSVQLALNEKGVIYFPPGQYKLTDNVNVFSDTTVCGEGTIVGTNIISPTPQLPIIYTIGFKIWGDSTITGPNPVGSPIGYSDIVAPNEHIFMINNNFAVGDLVMISNFPTAADGSDTCTLTTYAPFTVNCDYPTQTITNQTKRQLRRKEFSVIEEAGPAHIKLADKTLFYYDQQTFKFSKVSPIKNVKFEGVLLDTIGIKLNLVKNFSMNIPDAKKVNFSASSCYNCSVTIANFDAQETAGALDFNEGSRHVSVKGNYKNFKMITANALVKFNQVQDSDIDITVTNAKRLPSAPLEEQSGVMLDSNYSTNPTGYSDVPSVNINAKIIADDADFGLTALAHVVAPLKGLTINYVGLGGNSGKTAPVYLKHVTDSVITISSTNPADYLRIDGGKRIKVYNGATGYLQMEQGYNILGGSPVNNEEIIFQNFAFKPSLSIPAVNLKQPNFNFVDYLTLLNVTFDISQIPYTSVDLAKFLYASNVIIKSPTVVKQSNQTPHFTAVNQVGGYVNTNYALSTFNNSWPTFVDISDTGQGLFKVLNDIYYNNGSGQYCKSLSETGNITNIVLARPYNPIYVGNCDPPPGNFKINNLGYTADTQGKYCRIAPGGQPQGIEYNDFPKYRQFTGYCDANWPTPTPSPIFPLGDVNHDNQVNFTDFDLLSTAFGTSYIAADFNGTGLVDIFDFNILVSH